MASWEMVFSMAGNLHYIETFPPVARLKTTHIVLALAAQLEENVYQLDMKSAFLNGEVEEVNVKWLEGSEVKSKEDKVYHLWNGQYGLNQVPRIVKSTSISSKMVPI